MALDSPYPSRDVSGSDRSNPSTSAERVEAADQLLPTLEEAFERKGPVLMECPIDYSENIEVWGKELDQLVCDVYFDDQEGRE